jgi:hypothetical protein
MVSPPAAKQKFRVLLYYPECDSGVPIAHTCGPSDSLPMTGHGQLDDHFVMVVPNVHVRRPMLSRRQENQNAVAPNSQHSGHWNDKLSVGFWEDKKNVGTDRLVPTMMTRHGLRTGHISARLEAS